MTNNFGRVAEFYVLDRVLKYPELDIDFNIQFDTESNGNTGQIKFWNLAQQSIEAMKKGNEFRLLAGYQGDIGLLMKGTIEKSTTKKENGNIVTEVILNDSTDKWTNATINRSWNVRTKASTVAKDIIDSIPLELGEFNTDKDFRYYSGKTFSTNAKKALEEVAEDLRVKLHVSNGKIYLRPESEANTRTVIRLDSSTGLLSKPEKINQDGEDRWRVNSLLRYKIQADSLLEVEGIAGVVRVVEGEHNGDWTTEVEVVKYAA